MCFLKVLVFLFYLEETIMVMLNHALLRVVEGRGRRGEKRKRTERKQREEEGKDNCYNEVRPAISLSAWKSQKDCRWHVRR